MFASIKLIVTIHVGTDEIVHALIISLQVDVSTLQFLVKGSFLVVPIELHSIS